MGQGREKERRNEGKKKEGKTECRRGGWDEKGKTKTRFQRKNLKKREMDGKEINIKHDYIERKRNKC